MAAAMKTIAAALFLGTLSLAAPAAAEDAYPSRPITMIVPFAPGGSTDAIGRIVAEGLRQALGQIVVVENRAGAGGSMGTAVIAQAPPDGYTIGIGTASTLAINPATYKNLSFDVLKDLVPIGEHRGSAEHHVAQSVGRCPGHGCLHRFCPRASGRAFLCVGRQRVGQPSARRAVQAGDRHRHRPRPLQGRRPGAHRSRRRSGPGHVRQFADIAAARA